MEKSSFKDFFTKDIYWEVEEVLDLDTKLKIFEDESQQQYSEQFCQQSQNPELVLAEQTPLSQQSSQKNSISKIITQSRTQEKTVCSHLKRSQMTLVEDSENYSQKLQVKCQTDSDSLQNSYIIQSCSDSQESQISQTIINKSIKNEQKIAKLGSLFKISSKIIQKAQNLIKQQNSSSLKNKKPQKIKIKKQKFQKQEKVQIKKQFLQDSLNQQNTLMLQVKQQNEIYASKIGIYGHYKILSKDQKKYLVELSKKYGVSQIAKAYNISVNNICRWKKSCQRKVGAGRKITNYELQKKMIDFVQRARQIGKKLTRKQIQDQAKGFSDNQDFKASKGWFQRFVQRNKSLFDQDSCNQ